MNISHLLNEDFPCAESKWTLAGERKPRIPPNGDPNKFIISFPDNIFPPNAKPPNIRPVFIERFGDTSAIYNPSSDEHLSRLSPTLRKLIRILGVRYDPKDPLNLTPYIRPGGYISSGGYGSVYRVKWLNPSKVHPPLAMKIINARPLADHKKQIKRDKLVKRELFAWKNLSHQNIVELVGIAYQNNDINQPSLVSTWIPNGNVRQFLENFPEYSRLPLLYGIASGVSYLHKNNIIHGDIKGDNVLIDEHGVPLLCDLGLSRVLRDDELWNTSATHAPGSVRWQAPELLRGHQATVTFASDVYAFGMTCLETITATIPFNQYQRDSMVMFAVVDGERPSVPSLPSIPADVEKLIAKCWDSEPSKRPAMTDASSLLESFLTDLWEPWHQFDPNPTLHISSCSLSPCGDTLVMGVMGAPQSVHIWDVRKTDPRPEAPQILYESALDEIYFAADGSRFTTQGSSTKIWQFGHDGLWSLLATVQECRRCKAFSPNGRLVAGVFQDQRSDWPLSIWGLIPDAQNSLNTIVTILYRITLPGIWNGPVFFNPNGSKLLTSFMGEYATTICGWNLDTGLEENRVFGVGSKFHFSSDYETFVSLDAGSLQLRWISTGSYAGPQIASPIPPRQITSAFIYPNEKAFILCSESGDVFVSVIASGVTLVLPVESSWAPLHLPLYGLGKVSVSPDGRTIFLVTSTGSFRAWKLFHR